MHLWASSKLMLVMVLFLLMKKSSIFKTFIVDSRRRQSKTPVYGQVISSLYRGRLICGTAGCIQQLQQLKIHLYSQLPVQVNYLYGSTTCTGQLLHIQNCTH